MEHQILLHQRAQVQQNAQLATNYVEITEFHGWRPHLHVVGLERSQLVNRDFSPVNVLKEYTVLFMTES